MRVDGSVSTIMILLDKKRIGAQELANMFGVSPRTVCRDIGAINMAGISVRIISGVGNGFEIMPDYKIDKQVFSTADLSAPLMGPTNLSDMVRGDELIYTPAKAKSFIPTDQAKNTEFKANQICIDLSPWIGSHSAQPCLKVIKVTLQESKLLTFEHMAYHGARAARTAEPYQLVLKGSRWYLYGRCHVRNNFRLFRLSRISNLQMQAGAFPPRDYQKPVLNFAEMWETMQTKIIIRIHESVMDRVLYHCSYEDFTPDGKEYYTVSLPFFENEYRYDILLSFGDKCKCSESLPVRTKIKHRTHDIAAIYEN